MGQAHSSVVFVCANRVGKIERILPDEAWQDERLPGMALKRGVWYV